MTSTMVPRSGTPLGAVRLALVLSLVAIGVTAVRFAGQLSPLHWLAAGWRPAPTDVDQLVFHFSSLPRLVVAALCGAALATAGAIFQHVLRNPLASPMTLGVSSGAQLALVVATIVAPTAFGILPDAAALVGGVASLAIVFAIAATQRFASLALILAGLSVSLFCGALGHVLKIFHQEYLASIFLWGAGSLAQDDWSVVERLWPRLAVLGLMAAVLVRPLRLLGLAEESARGLGVSLAVYRTATLAVAVGLAASVTASVGLIGFVEIAAPLVARLAGARTLGSRLVLSAIIGAAMLVIIDAAVQMLGERVGATLPTGAATALLGAPLLLWLLPRMRSDGSVAEAGIPGGRRTRNAGRRLGWLAGLAALSLVLAIVVGRTGVGWTLIGHDTWHTLAPWRVPRSVAGFAAGAMLATAGAILQRSTGNPIASPEILGLGAAVMAGLAVALLVVADPSQPVLLGFGAAGAGVLLVILMGRGLRSRFAPDHLLLTGIALGAALDAVVIAFLALNDGRAILLLNWLAGSTASADAGSAGVVLLLALVLIPATLVFARSLDLLPLGEALARSLGVSLGATRFGVFLIAALLTAGAVLTVGPLTFVGLIGPHVARRLGFERAAFHIPGAALVGGLVMVLADWLGRVLLAPFEIPAGLMASLIGIPYLVAQLRRRDPSSSVSV